MSDGIWKVNLDGSGHAQVVRGVGSEIYSISINYNSSSSSKRWLCWSDQSKLNTDTLRTAEYLENSSSFFFIPSCFFFIQICFFFIQI